MGHYKGRKREDREQRGVGRSCAEQMLRREKTRQKRDRSGDAGTTEWDCRRREEGCKGRSWPTLG